MRYIISRKFVMMPIFDKQWKAMGLNDDDLYRLQKVLLDYPDIGKVIKGTGKLRKMRYTFKGRGKRGQSE